MKKILYVGVVLGVFFSGLPVCAAQIEEEEREALETLPLEVVEKRLIEQALSQRPLHGVKVFLERNPLRSERGEIITPYWLLETLSPISGFYGGDEEYHVREEIFSDRVLAALYKADPAQWLAYTEILARQTHRWPTINSLARNHADALVFVLRSAVQNTPLDKPFADAPLFYMQMRTLAEHSSDPLVKIAMPTAAGWMGLWALKNPALAKEALQLGLPEDFFSQMQDTLPLPVPDPCTVPKFCVQIGFPQIVSERMYLISNQVAMPASLMKPLRQRGQYKAARSLFDWLKASDANNRAYPMCVDLVTAEPVLTATFDAMGGAPFAKPNESIVSRAEAKTILYATLKMMEWCEESGEGDFTIGYQSGIYELAAKIVNTAIFLEEEEAQRRAALILEKEWLSGKSFMLEQEEDDADVAKQNLAINLAVLWHHRGDGQKARDAYAKMMRHNGGSPALQPAFLTALHEMLTIPSPFSQPYRIRFDVRALGAKLKKARYDKEDEEAKAHHRQALSIMARYADLVGPASIHDERAFALLQTLKKAPTRTEAHQTYAVVASLAKANPSPALRLWQASALSVLIQHDIRTFAEKKECSEKECVRALEKSYQTLISLTQQVPANTAIMMEHARATQEIAAFLGTLSPNTVALALVKSVAIEQARLQKYSETHALFKRVMEKAGE